MSITSAPIVVGLDGSSGAQAALGWAVDEARRRKAPLRLVNVVEPAKHPGAWQETVPPLDLQREMSWSVLTSAMVDLEGVDVGAEPRAEFGQVASTLLEQAERAQLVVVGSRGHGELAGLLLGSVSLQVAMHAPCPVVVVRPPTHDTMSGSAGQRVVVGIDGTEGSEAAIAFAFEEADLRHVGLTAIHTWTAHPIWVAAASVDERQAVADEERALLAERLAGWSEKYPDVEVVQRVIMGDPATILVKASDGAGLTVVGSRGAGGFRGLLLGSVSHAVLHRANSPVAVVRLDEFSR